VEILIDVKSLLGLPEELELVDGNVTDKIITITAISTQTTSCCPLCGINASRVHSRYSRQLADVPCAQKHVRLTLQVRKFFCDVKTCPRKIFTERLAPFIQPWARVTTRLFQEVENIGLATSGMLGTRLLDRIGIRTSWMTIIRRIMARPASPAEQVSEVGIDDFSFRRGRKFGTILVNLKSHQVIDLLPDRKAERAAAWMSAHPEIELVSRDRGGDYAAGARQGAPQATQVADRFHLYKNLLEAVELTLARCRAEIRKNGAPALQQEEMVPLVVENSESVSVENWKPAPDPGAERERLARRAERHDRYEQVLALRAQGLGNTEIAQRVGLSIRTVQRWQASPTFPEAKRHRKRQSSFDPYAAYVLKRWEEGCHNGLSLWREIKDQGYTGSAPMVYRFLVPLRKKQRIIQTAEVPHVPLQDFRAADAVWLFARDPLDLDEKERETVRTICQASETSKTTYRLVQEFRDMLHHRKGEKLEAWLAQVTASQIRELQTFVLGVERDKAAVIAGLTFSQNNGMVEGKINKLKLIKRMMFGRAAFPLLRQRVLHAL